MKNVKLLLFVILFSKSINAQTNLGNTFSGSGNPATLLCPQTRAAFTDEKVNQLIVEILNVSNLKNRFIIMPCSGISNCQAIYYEGKPYILYNAAFLNEIKGLSFSEKDLVVSERNWESLTILAHELGHHFNNHLNNPPPGATPQQLELEADEFAGSTIYMLGGSLIQSQSAFKSESVSESYTHPGRMARLAAVAKGWNDAKSRNNAPKNVVVKPESNDMFSFIDEFNTTDNSNWVLWKDDSTAAFVDGGKFHLYNNVSGFTTEARLFLLDRLKMSKFFDKNVVAFNDGDDFSCSVSLKVDKSFVPETQEIGLSFLSTGKVENYFLLSDYGFKIVEYNGITKKWTDIVPFERPYLDSKKDPISYSTTKSRKKSLNKSTVEDYLIKLNEFNNLKIEKYGNELTFYINNRLVAKIPANSITSGTIFNLFAGSKSYGIFDNFILKSISSH